MVLSRPELKRIIHVAFPKSWDNAFVIVLFVFI